MESFTNLYSQVHGDTTGESYGQMKGYYTPESYIGFPSDVQESKLTRATEYRDELTKRLPPAPLTPETTQETKKKGIFGNLFASKAGGCLVDKKDALMAYYGGGKVKKKKKKRGY